MSEDAYVDKTYTFETIYLVVDDDTGSRYEVGADEQGFCLTEIRLRNGKGYITDRLPAMDHQQLLMLSAAIEKRLRDLEPASEAMTGSEE